MTHIDQMTLEELEQDVWPDPEIPSYLVTTCHQLRKKRLSEFQIEDLRIMLGQSIGTKHLMPKALVILKENPLASGRFFEGDLLAAIARYAENTQFLSRLDSEILIGASKSVLASIEYPLPENNRLQVREMLARLESELQR